MINLLFESGLICKDCGEEFEQAVDGDLCPYCYSNNIDHEVVQLTYVDKFYGTNNSVSTNRRLMYPLPDCRCFIIAMDDCYGTSGYWNGKDCDPIKDNATIFTNQNVAYQKIQYSHMDQYCHPRVIEVSLVNNKIV